MSKSEHLTERRKGRNISVGLLLGGFVVLVFAVTVVKLSQNENFRGSDRIPGADTVVISE